MRAGKAPLTDSVLPRQEAILIAQWRDDLAAQHAQANADLRRFIGEASDYELHGDAPDWFLDRPQPTHLLPNHPDLQRYTPEANMVDAQVAEANAAKNPDWALDLAKQQTQYLIRCDANESVTCRYTKVQQRHSRSVDWHKASGTCGNNRHLQCRSQSYVSYA